MKVHGGVGVGYRYGVFVPCRLSRRRNGEGDGVGGVCRAVEYEIRQPILRLRCCGGDGQPLGGGEFGGRVEMLVLRRGVGVFLVGDQPIAPVRARRDLAVCGVADDDSRSCVRRRDRDADGSDLCNVQHIGRFRAAFVGDADGDVVPVADGNGGICLIVVCYGIFFTERRCL